MVEENVIKLRRAQLDTVVLFLGMMTWILVCVAMIMRNLYQ